MKRFFTFLILLFCFFSKQSDSQIISNIGIDVNGYIYSLQSYNGKLYIGGSFWQINNITPVDNIIQWDGANWDSLASGLNSSVFDLTVYNNELIAGGDFHIGLSCSGWERKILAWTGTSWDSLGNFGTFSNSHVNTAQAIDNVLYVGCEGFNDCLSYFSDMGKWNGTSWDSLAGASSINSWTGHINCFAKYNNLIYLGDNNGLSSWNGINAMHISS